MTIPPLGIKPYVTSDFTYIGTTNRHNEDPEQLFEAQTKNCLVWESNPRYAAQYEAAIGLT